MSKKSVVIESAIAILGSDKVQKFLCGTYSDGKPRSLPDALNDELLSPKQKQNKKAIKKHKKKSKKKHKKKKSIQFEL